MVIYSKERVYVFVDGPNLTAHQTDFRIDPAGLRELGLRFGNKIAGASWYDLKPELPEISLMSC